MYLNYFLRFSLCFFFLSFLPLILIGQAGDGQINMVPFLRFTPDARAAAMGDAGVAIIPDGHASSINASKLPFLEHASGISFSYNPWLKNLNAAMHLSYLSAYHRLNDRNTIAASIRYFSLGEVQLSDINQQSLGVYYPNEFAIDGTFARKFGPRFALATTLRYISSQLLSSDLATAGRAKASTAVAADVSAYYKWKTRLFHQDVVLGTGANISNIGHKIGTANGSSQYFLPANLKVGMALSFLLPEASRFSLALDLNKSLIPSHLVAAERDGMSVLSAMSRSFADADGTMKAELRDIDMGMGVEYLFSGAFALRAGYSYQNPDRGNRSYLSLGTGFNFEGMGLNVAYIAASQEKSPLANSLRFSLLFKFNPISN